MIKYLLTFNCYYRSVHGYYCTAPYKVNWKMFCNLIQIYRVTEEAYIAETKIWPIPFLINMLTVFKGSQFDFYCSLPGCGTYGSNYLDYHGYDFTTCTIAQYNDNAEYCKNLCSSDNSCLGVAYDITGNTCRLISCTPYTSPGAWIVDPDATTYIRNCDSGTCIELKFQLIL